MLGTVTAASHPTVAALLGLGAAGLAAVVVAMAWNVNARQIRLAERLARRQFIVTGETGPPGHALNGHGSSEAALVGAQEVQESQESGAAQRGQRVQGAQKAQGTRRPVEGRSAKLVIDGPDTVAAGEQVRYRVLPSGPGSAVTWAVGGGSVSQSPDPAHPDELLLIADQPGNLILTVRVREGLTERREMKSVTAVPDVTAAATPPFTLRLFLHAWGLVVVAILVVGFAGALVALGNLTSADFIALVVPLTALLGVIAAVRGTGEGRPGHGKSTFKPEP